MHIRSLNEAKEVLRNLKKQPKMMGSIHTLGALHEGHGKVIEISSKENDYTFVTIYPNKIQLDPKRSYEYDLIKDVELAYRYGATHVLSVESEDMYPESYCTFIDQGKLHQRLDGIAIPYLFRGMVTMCIRWLSLVRPDVTYFGLKDIGQAVLVKRAIEDLLIDTKVREIPCIRYKCGVPISSRLFKLNEKSFLEVEKVYFIIEQAREAIKNGERNTKSIINFISGFLKESFHTFKIIYINLVDPDTFSPLELIKLPFILHVVITDGNINHFDGIYVRSIDDLCNGVNTIWLDSERPSLLGI